MLIYRVPDKDGEWPIVEKDVGRSTESEVTISLPDGQFVAEIGAVVGNNLTLLRSSPFTVPTTTQVSLLARTRSCAAMIGAKVAHVRQVALRRLGDGEVRWSSENSASPVVVTSPSESYVASCVADLDHKYMAMWTPKQLIRTSKLIFPVADPLELRFTLRDGTPPLSSSHVTLSFPDAFFTINDPAQAIFITNRNRMDCNYPLETTAKEKLAFIGGACLIKSKATFEMGGPLKPKLFAGFVWSENGGGWDAGALKTFVELVDSGGLILDGGSSQLNYRTELFLAPENQKRVPLEGNMPGFAGFKPDLVQAEVHYNYGGRTITSVCRGEDLVRVYSEHFSIGTPPMWTFKARQFLSCLEAIRLLTIKNTGRPGPASFRVDWRSNGHDAKSIVGYPQGGAQDIWMSFPWWTFETYWDPFAEPWFGNRDPYICHEILHSFGYHHGGEMSQLEWRAEDQYRSIRWRAVDTGEWVVGQYPLRGEGNAGE